MSDDYPFFEGVDGFNEGAESAAASVCAMIQTLRDLPPEMFSEFFNKDGPATLAILRTAEIRMLDMASLFRRFRQTLADKRNQAGGGE